MSGGPLLPADVWDRLPPEARALIQALRAEVQALQQQVRDLRERLNENSTNSSRPPSRSSSGRSSPSGRGTRSPPRAARASGPAGEIEFLVVEQVRCVGRDPALLREVLEQARRQNEEQAAGPEAEGRSLGRDLARW